MSSTTQKTSPFLHPTSHTTPNALAVLHLRRDAQIPILLKPPHTASSDLSTSESGYAEGAVTNTRFGSYPHSTLINVPWGSQVLASKVDTGSRGRKKGKQEKKRKAEEAGLDEDGDAATAAAGGGNEGEAAGNEDDELGTRAGGGARRREPKAAVAASSGFCHILPPTPESWTVSLPHRTQVVYTPDYSFIIQKLRVRPGSVVIEAGGGSGSFTHAAARACFDGYAGRTSGKAEVTGRNEGKRKEVDREAGEKSQAGKGVASSWERKPTARSKGRVYSFEYHEPRAQRLQAEIVEHGLEDVVHVTHRDVYHDGFCIAEEDEPESGSKDNHQTLKSSSLNDNATTSPRTADADPEKLGKPPAPADQRSEKTFQSPKATSIFLDLPAPWQTLPHLTRQEHSNPQVTSTQPAPNTSPLNPNQPVHLCAFLPCVEQATKFTDALRTHDWVDISMHELSHKRLEVRRERYGLPQVSGLSEQISPWQDSITSVIPRWSEAGLDMHRLSALRGVSCVPSTIEESCERLKQVEQRGRDHRAMTIANANANAGAVAGGGGGRAEAEGEEADPAERSRAAKSEGPGIALPDEEAKSEEQSSKNPATPAAASETNLQTPPSKPTAATTFNKPNKPQPQQQKPQPTPSHRSLLENRILATTGRLVTRSEPEIKTHTSYLVFAILPRSWGESEEQAARGRVARLLERRVLGDGKVEGKEGCEGGKGDGKVEGKEGKEGLSKKARKRANRAERERERVEKDKGQSKEAAES